MVTRGVLLMRLVFHEPSSVEISSLPSSYTPQTVVGFGLPSLVNVVRIRYLDRATSSKVSVINLDSSFDAQTMQIGIPAGGPGETGASATPPSLRWSHCSSCRRAASRTG